MSSSKPQQKKAAPPPAMEPIVYEVVWKDGGKRPGIAYLFIKSLFEDEIRKRTPLDNEKIQVYPEPREVGEIMRKLDEVGLKLVKKEKKEYIRVGEFQNQGHVISSMTFDALIP